MEKLAEQQPTKQFFLRASKDWVNTVHKKEISQEEQYTILKYMQEPDENMDYESADQFFRTLVNDNVFSGHNTQRPENRSLFPGPMAVQMGRKHLNYVRDLKYWITEKSDGIRCMMLTLYEPNLTKWKIIEPMTKMLNWLDSSAIEVTYNHAKREDERQFDIELEDGSYSFDAENLTLEKNSTIFKLKRVQGCSFSYLFDRKYSFYLCTEEFLFPTPESFQYVKKQETGELSYQRVLILDGEVLYNFRDRRYNYTIYDIITLSVQKDLSRNISSPWSCSKLNIEKKLKTIDQCVIQPHYFLYKEVLKTNTPKCLFLILKHFYPKEQVEEILSHIKKDEKSGEYLYKNYNKNDGLVFTPDDTKYYTFLPGTNNFLLKWKWTDKLTCDFEAYPNPTNDKFSLKYMVYKQKVIYKDVYLTKDNKPLERKECVVECLFDRENQKWVVLCLRNDKTHGNGFNVVSNTLENVIENLTREELIDVIKGKSSNKNMSIKNDKEYIQDVMNSDYYAHFEIGKKKDQFLYIQVKHFPKNSRDATTNYQRVWDCIGPEGDTNADLESIVNQLYQDARSRKQTLCARCIFIPSLGIWKIMDFKGSLERATGNQLVSTLEKVASLTAKNKLKRKINEIE
eukprot:gene2899-4742_t